MTSKGKDLHDGERDAVDRGTPAEEILQRRLDMARAETDVAVGHLREQMSDDDAREFYGLDISQLRRSTQP